MQRPLWASTSTKNPAYPDLLYVEPLEGPDTVNTMPESTIAAFLDHGVVECAVDKDVDEAEETLARLDKVGVDLADVTKVLEEQGVAAFKQSYDDLIGTLGDKAAALRGAA